MSTLGVSSRNPFRSNGSTPNITGSRPESTPSPPSFSSAVTPPPQVDADVSRIPHRSLGVDEAVDEPPPYTPQPSATTGETTIEQGPRRPFQTAPSPNTAARVQHTVDSRTGNSSHSSLSPPRRERQGGLLQQLTGALNNMVDSLERAQNSSYAGGTVNRWSSYPGQQAGRPQPQPQPQPQQPQQYAPPSHPPPRPISVPPPPPRHPSSQLPPAISSTPSSDFARDFYAVGPAEEVLRREEAIPNEEGYAPPPGPTPSLPGRPARATSSSQSVPDNGRPTTHPVVGHPLLHEGKILVYPDRYECDKCHNIGYKNSDPLRPCKRCWKKYARPFSGPLAYSFGASPDSKFQRPLRTVPPPAPPPIPPSFSFSAPPAQFAPGGYMTNHHGGFYTPPTGVRPAGFTRPPPGAVVYTAGDPRIGGRLCWRCDGKGNTSFLLLDRITCEVCGGIGRTFN